MIFVEFNDPVLSRLGVGMTSREELIMPAHDL